MPVSKKEQCVFTTLRTGLPRQAAKVNAENRARTLFSFFGECMREMVLCGAQDQAEELAEALLDFGVVSVSVEDAEENTIDAHPLYGEPGVEPEVLAWRRNLVVAIFTDEMYNYEFNDYIKEVEVLVAGLVVSALSRVSVRDIVLLFCDIF